MKPLISIGDLISRSFTTVKETWVGTLKYTVWFFLMPFVGGLCFSMGSAGFAAAGRSNLPLLGVGLEFIGFGLIAMALMMIGLLWAGLGLMQYLLAYSKGTNMKGWKPKQPALHLILGSLWIGFLGSLPAMGIVLVTAVFASLFAQVRSGEWLTFLLIVAAIVCMVWIGMLLSQAQLLFVDQDIRGMEALKKSVELVRGRWWASFWRLVIPPIVLQLIIGFIWMVFILIFLAVFSVLIGGFVAAYSANGGTDWREAMVSALSGGFGAGLGLLFLFGCIGFVLQVARVIIQIIFQNDVFIRLFRSLQDSK